jgi:hypothetical protein
VPYSIVLARPHLSIAAGRRSRLTKPDLSLLDGVVAPEVLSAMHTASGALRDAGVRHVVVGGLAVGANGFPRATKDVDFLVGDEAFEHHAGGLVTLRAGVPFQVRGVAIDFLAPDPHETFLAASLTSEPGMVIDGPALVYLKLKSPRHKDRTDVIEMIKGGLDADGCRRYLERNAPSFLPGFEDALTRARAEED